MPFHVIELETGSPVLNATGDCPMLFNEGREAASAARDYSNQTGKKYQPRPVQSDTWKQREQARFDSGHYQRLPWHDSPWFVAAQLCNPSLADHYAHVSTERDGMVAFTESPEKGAADRQTRQRPGTYLQRFYSDKLSADEIQALARDYAGKFEDNVLLFADTADDIERVYTEGPRSCMSNRARDYSSPFHPVRVYAAGDLAVAYTMRGGSIVARVLCWPKQKKFSRVYGDDDRLRPLLESAGYVHGRLTGARLTRHECDGGFVCPYIDETYRVEDRGDFLCIGGDLVAESTAGIIQGEDDDRPSCEHCGETCDEDSTYFMEDATESWCESCADDAYQCARTGNRYARERNVVLMANGDYWSTREFERHGFTCEGNGENYHIDESVHVDGGNTVWCQDYFDKHGFQCHGCSECFDNDVGVETMGDMYCEDCAPDPEEDSDESEHVTSSPKRFCRQGRDELPGQLELPLSNARFHPDDIVRLVDNEESRAILRFRCENNYPAWEVGQTFVVVSAYDNGNIRLGIDETWEGMAFERVNRNGGEC